MKHPHERLGSGLSLHRTSRALEALDAARLVSTPSDGVLVPKAWLGIGLDRLLDL